MTQRREQQRSAIHHDGRAPAAHVGLARELQLLVGAVIEQQVQQQGTQRQLASTWLSPACGSAAECALEPVTEAHPGTAPHPFFYAAYRTLKKRVKGRISRAMKKAIRESARP